MYIYGMGIWACTSDEIVFALKFEVGLARGGSCTYDWLDERWDGGRRMQQVLETRAARGYRTPFGDCLAPCDIFHLPLKTINSSPNINCPGNYIQLCEAHFVVPLQQMVSSLCLHLGQNYQQNRVKISYFENS